MYDNNYLIKKNKKSKKNTKVEKIDKKSKNYYTRKNYKTIFKNQNIKSKIINSLTHKSKQETKAYKNLCKVNRAIEDNYDFKTLNDTLKANEDLKKKEKQYDKTFLKMYNNLTLTIDGEIVSAFSDKAKNRLLNNVYLLKNISYDKIIVPKQRLGNCWFNVLFLTFFISDKGFSFFKFFRLLMIKGIDSNNNQLSKEVHYAFMLLNLSIEAAYNIFPECKEFNDKFNTNYIIFYLGEAIKKNKLNTDFIFNINQAGNPYAYYYNICNRLSLSTNNMLLINPTITLSKKELPNLLVIDYSFSFSSHLKKKQLLLHDKKYVLDSVCIIDNSGQHYCCVIHINNKEYGFDGASTKKITPFKWKHLLNKNKNWTFRGTNKDTAVKIEWNFTKGNSLLFYYLV